jgi:hypothetical protein
MLSPLGRSALAIVLLLLCGGISPDLAHANTQSPGEEPGVAAQEVAPIPAESEDRYRVYLITIGQGDEVWELFGHNALLIVDNLTGEQLAWNWGLFNFDDSGFLLRFLKGTMRYTMGPADAEALFRSYLESERTVYANEIFLTEEEAANLDAFVRTNFLPENRPYIYQYFRDNCSTRVRDALDGVLGGFVHETFGDRSTPHSYRWHSRRLVQVKGWVDQGLSFLLGTRGDLPITEWEAMFAPLELMRLLEGVQRPSPSGEQAPLLGPRITVVESTHEELPLPPSFSPLWLALGLALGSAVVGLSIAGSRRGEWGRVGAYLGIAGWGLSSGLLGLLLLLAWFTDHEFIRWNLNLFYLSPLGIPHALVSILLIQRNRMGGALARFARGSALLIALLAVGVALLQASHFVTQGNAEVVALALPVNLGVAWGLRILNGTRKPEFPGR